MEYKREYKGNCFVVVADEQERVVCLHSLQLVESDKVLLEITNTQQWYNFIRYCRFKYEIDVKNFDGTPDEFKELWNEFNSDGSI